MYHRTGTRSYTKVILVSRKRPSVLGNFARLAHFFCEWKALQGHAKYISLPHPKTTGWVTSFLVRAKLFDGLQIRVRHPVFPSSILQRHPLWSFLAISEICLFHSPLFLRFTFWTPASPFLFHCSRIVPLLFHWCSTLAFHIYTKSHVYLTMTKFAAMPPTPGCAKNSRFISLPLSYSIKMGSLRNKELFASNLKLRTKEER